MYCGHSGHVFLVPPDVLGRHRGTCGHCPGSRYRRQLKLMDPHLVATYLLGGQEAVRQALGLAP